MAGAANGVPSPHVQRHPPPSGSRPRAPVKQVVSGVVKTISPGRQLADKLEQRRRALVPFANPGPRLPTPMETTGSHNVTVRLEPTLPEAYDLDLDPDPDLVPGGLEDLGYRLVTRVPASSDTHSSAWGDLAVLIRSLRGVQA